MRLPRKTRTLLTTAALAALPAVLALASPAMAQSHESTGDRHYWLPEGVSTFSHTVDHLFYYCLYLTVVINIAVFIALGVFLIRYRHRDGRHATFIHGNNKLETVWTLIPTIILALTAVFSQASWSEIKNPPINMVNDPRTIQMQIVAQQFAWNFHYAGKDGKIGQTYLALRKPKGTPEEVVGLNRGENITLKSGEMVWGKIAEETDSKIKLATIEFNEKNEPIDKVVEVRKGDIFLRNHDGADDYVLPLLVVPVGRAVNCRLTSIDVIHSFFLPNFRLKQDAMPGMNGKLWFQAEKTSGEVVGRNPDEPPLQLDETSSGARVKISDNKPFDVVCAELCGQGHFKMRGTMYVVSEAEYAEFTRINEANVAAEQSEGAGY